MPQQSDVLQASHDFRWAAVVARDAKADGQFFYAVSSTKIYCRPSCGARAPKPENVSFFLTSTEAEQAGYRPCLRCLPNQPPLAERQATLVADLCRQIETAETAPTLEALAQGAQMSAFHLRRLFKSITGLTPKAYATAHRAGKMRDELGRGSSVTEAIYAAGYNANSRFYSEAEQVLGMTPKRYRAGGAGTVIRFALGQSALGAILVAATERGVCAILLGDDPELLIGDLQYRFPKAELLSGDAEFEQFVAAVVGFVEAPKLGLELPLDVQGTAFQQRVWQALRDVPVGTTVSYSDLAQRIGSPKSVRAVAGACAANPLAVAIPCHRVVRIDGGLSGYRWGVERKRALLDLESEA
ncbi:MAG TPA: bifunctional DNA-binding transcriptional regulator/O6-methylguanine-DNA methyltransferase Ada [Pseudomonas xinjiangensis]|uniref:methylated-DNA--[protein]-cysteine S-methyltransferase n=2 Tax=root TaxID=1 RepID=A0A7V1BP83_9GAMM|nr:bifunctional DNA-binding transcriptional regulator/O6-methylguanine-DNA methyltransferase Ada [Halopseudomonas xinjiangensis]HEC47296.1 bifunctional DNA-binding transcriptional regulator/O6-methylguanine-DNA methyltransferase Ada [Halopseudomonas xinjiangensis]